MTWWSMGVMVVEGHDVPVWWSCVSACGHGGRKATSRKAVHKVVPTVVESRSHQHLDDEAPRKNSASR